jgi:pyruvate/2-oxoglutarate dehydrogenase complex dihydrolipoamide dehydrogenase (E3) component
VTDRTAADVVVIGLGPGGEEAAGRLAEAGLDVIGVDERLVGGECPYWGCIPSKMMIRAAGALAEGRRIPLLAGRSTVEADWSPVARRVREEATDGWDDRAAVERLERRGARFLRGHGRIVDAGQVAVTHGDSTKHIAVRRAILLNTGTSPSIPPIDGLDSVPYWTNREAIETDRLPGSLVVLGGGAIGLELAQVFARFGSRVSVVEAAERLLPLEEPESSDLIAHALAKDGVDVRVGAGAKTVAGSGGDITVRLAEDSELRCEHLLVATGRRVDLKAVGAENLGLDANRRSIPVDSRLRVTDRVWAIGDITGKGAFTHVSMYQSAIAVRDILGEDGPPADYKALPRVTFTDPEVGSVGLSEAAAREEGLEVRTGSAPLQESSRGWIHKVGNEGIIKLVEDAKRGVLVGATSVGPSGGEVLGLLALAVHAEVPTSRLRTMIFAYPTFHRAIEAALADLG